MNDYISAYEYETNVNPLMEKIPIYTKNIKDCNFGINFINNAEIYKVNFNATSPNLLASFIKIKDKDSFLLLDNINATSNFFFILNGKVEIYLDNILYILKEGDIIIFPTFHSLHIINTSMEELQIYYINDSPLLNYLGSKSIDKIFNTAIYSKEYLLKNLENLSNPNNNRKGILLSNKDTEKIGNNTITPVLWALYNELPPQTIQKPHKHNSVALDLCIECNDSENIYTLIGEEIDENGNIKNPIKINWKKGEMFITPPGLWHSHNNKGNTFAYVLPIQDAGLLLYQRILGITFC